MVFVSIGLLLPLEGSLAVGMRRSLPRPSLLPGPGDAGNGRLLLVGFGALFGFWLTAALLEPVASSPPFLLLASLTSASTSLSCCSAPGFNCPSDDPVACRVWLPSWFSGIAATVSASSTRWALSGELGSTLLVLLLLAFPFLLDGSGGMPECRREILARNLDRKSPMPENPKMDEPRMLAHGAQAGSSSRPQAVVVSGVQSPDEDRGISAAKCSSSGQRRWSVGCCYDVCLFGKRKLSWPF